MSKLCTKFLDRNRRRIWEEDLPKIAGGAVKLTFLYFPFPPLHKLVKTSSLPLFALADLASNKAYAIGRRPAYRDYVDIFLS